MKYYVGIDLGGTNISAGVVNENYEIIAKASTKTNCPRPASEIAEDMAKTECSDVRTGFPERFVCWQAAGSRI